MRHKKSVEHLTRQIENLRLILDTAFEGIYAIDTEGNCTLCNASCLSLLGYKHESELLGKNMHNIIHSRRLDGTYCSEDECKLFQALKKGEGAHVRDEVFWRADGTYFPVEYFSFPQFRDRKIIGAVVTFVDITERKKAESGLRESERSKAMLLSNLPGMAYRCDFDRDWTMQFVSDGCFKLTGYLPENLLYNKNVSYNSLIVPGYRDVVWEEWSRALALKEVFKYEYPIRTASGDIKWVFEQGQGVYNRDGDAEALEGLIIDINDRKVKEQEIQYISYHDHLTDLYNRRYIEEAKARLDTEENMPISIIIGDINGVRLINDAFGHAAGDALIVRTAKIIKDNSRKDDIVARIGGDEFGVLMPKTDLESARQVMEGIRATCETYNSTINGKVFRIDLSLGCSTKTTVDEDIETVIKDAEGHMNKRKLLKQRSFHSVILSSIKATMFERSQETEEHAERLADMTGTVGKHLELTRAELDELELLAMLHDIGKVGIEDRILNKPGKLTDEEWDEMKRHPEIGYRIAMSSPDLASIAEYILYHHERWDGKGYPHGLQGEDIPLLSRILAVADAYDAMTQDRTYREAMTKEEAITEIKENSGTQFDPNIAEIFLNKVLGSRV